MAVKMEADFAASKRDGGIVTAFQQVVSARRKAFIGALKCMYFLVKEKTCTHYYFFASVRACEITGSLYLLDVQVGGNAMYTSERFMQELVQCLGESVSVPLLVQVRQSPFLHYALMKPPMYL